MSCQQIHTYTSLTGTLGGYGNLLGTTSIVYAEYRLFAYDLLFRQSMACASAQLTRKLQAAVEVISNTLCPSHKLLLQGKLVFINNDLLLNQMPSRRRLPPGQPGS